VRQAPLYAAMLCRKSLEEWVRWMYEHDYDLALPYDTTLNSLIHAQGFKNLVAPNQFNQINLVCKLGNPYYISVYLHSRHGKETLFFLLHLQFSKPFSSKPSRASWCNR